MKKVYKSKQAAGHCHSPLLEVEESSRSTANMAHHDLQQMEQSKRRQGQVEDDQLP